jgi:hypothetical protein
MTPSVIGIKLQAVKRPLSEINLQSIVVLVSLSYGVAFGPAKALRIGIRLEVVNRIACTGCIERTGRDVCRTWGKSRAD